MEDIVTTFSRLKISGLLDILLVTAVILAFLVLIRGTRAMLVLRGALILVLIILVITSVFNLPAFSWLLEKSLPAILLAIPVIFQPEIRRALEQLGHTSSVFRVFRRDTEQPAVKAFQEASLRLSQRRHGALVVFEQETGLREYIDTGVLLDAEPSAELILTIFNKNTELHDGAVIISKNRLVAASCIMPLSTSHLTDLQMGLRHRAALGISEVSDAVAVVISEETGQVSIAHNGRIIRNQDIAHLDSILNALLHGGQSNVEEQPA